MGLSRFSHWVWPRSTTRTRRAREPPVSSVAMAGVLFPDSPSGFREPDAVRVPSSGGGARPPKGNRRRDHDEARIDREHDMVIVPSGGCGFLSDSDSDSGDSDWSIGWLEPQGPVLHSDGDSDGSFAVLVPCYRHGRVEERGRFADGNVSETKNFVERWLSSLPN
ncbi:hypothetical protein GUJ93_ZPchr0010g8942 [Zizania palustris]|uniref:Uncharacterized protein n=1 Tax=Zizania palustris TaxID=103762 RepID=A0A8J5WCZ3_ZIZPA|nr:hypothetical protein GUJ93_ZPchr0010g8942 [Zizania palustris]